MNIKIGMNCVNEQLCDYIANGFGVIFVVLLVWFAGYIVWQIVNKKK